MTTILIVEDDARLAAGLRYRLEREGYDVRHAEDGPTGSMMIEESRPDLVILDLMLPGVHGYDVLSELRERDAELPVIILSAQSTEDDQVRGFATGANDFVGKPFRVRELLARVRARLPKTPRSEEFAIAGGRVSLAALEFRRGKEATSLTPTEAQLLRLLRADAGKPVDRAEILRRIWGTSDSTTRTLDTHIRRLRRKIEPDPSRPSWIVTVHGVGYRLALDS